MGAVADSLTFDLPSRVGRERAALSAADRPPVLTRSWPAIAHSVPAARRALVALAEAAGASSEQLDAVRLASSEALTNIVVHAYPAKHAGLIHVAATVASGELWIVIADDGGGLRARKDSPGLGHGLRLIADACEELTILQRAGGGTELRIRFNLGDDEKTREDRSAHAPARAIQSRGSVASASAPASPRLATTR
jgi:anti-sigma regulatory factor (Ser/Thr protein kinase)